MTIAPQNPMENNEFNQTASELELAALARPLQSARLQQLLYRSLPFLLSLYAIGMVQALFTRNWLFAALETVVVLLAAAVTFVRSGGDRLRAASLLVVLYGAGLLATVLTPLSGLSQLIFLVGVYSALVLFGLQVALFYTLLGGVTLAAGGYTLLMGYLPLANTLAAEYNSLLFWLATGAFFILSGLLLASLQNMVQGGWQTLLSSFQREKLAVEVERDSLKERSEGLEKRLLQLQAVSDISRFSNTINDPGALMDQLVNSIQERFDLYYAGIFLLDENKEYAVLEAGSGQAGKQMVNNNHQLPLGDSSMVGWAVANAQARIALDTAAESIRYHNPLLPHTRSELALPLRSGKQVIGALTIQSDQPNAFDDNDLTVLQGLADAIAIAVQNARRYQEIQSHLKEIEALNRQYLISAWSSQLEGDRAMEYIYQDESAPASQSRGELFQSSLVIRDQVIGSLVVESSAAGWTDEEINLIEAVASQASQALENARLLKETRNKAYQEQLISDFSTNIRESFNLDEILRTAVRELGDRLNLAEVEAHIGWNEAYSAQDPSPQD